MRFQEFMLSTSTRSFASDYLLRARRSRCQIRFQTRSFSKSSHARTKAPRPDTQTIKVADNRVLGFAEYGDLSGEPLFYFHGFPASRLSCAAWDNFAYQHKIRMISVDRPGIGLSTFQPDRKILDWPKDILTLADRLGIASFRVWGVSGGGAYALACAYSIPQDQLRGVGILAGPAPWPEYTQGMSFRRHIRWSLASFAPAMWARWEWGSQTKDAQDLNLEKWYARQERKPGGQILDKGVRIAKMESERAAFIQGLDGVAHELKLFTSPWGFELEDIKFPGVILWYGGADDNTPPQSGKYIAARLHRSKLRIYPGETHYTITGTRARVQEILRDVMGRPGRSNATVCEFATVTDIRTPEAGFPVCFVLRASFAVIELFSARQVGAAIKLLDGRLTEVSLDLRHALARTPSSPISRSGRNVLLTD